MSLAANEIVSNARYQHDKKSLLDVVQHLRIISNVAIEGNEGELNTTLLSRVITFFNILSSCMEEHCCEFNIVVELTKLLEHCTVEDQNNFSYATSSNIDACITVISENAPPSESLQVLSEWKHTSVESPSHISALHTALIRGARQGVRKELSGALLRIQRAREEGRRPIVENDVVWNNVVDEQIEEEEKEGFIWPSVLDGTLVIAK